MSVINVNQANFEKEVLESEKTVLLDFYANWCGPCKMVAPLINQLAQEHPEFVFGKVNVDESLELAQAFGVTSIPMLAVLQNGKVIKQAVGARGKEEILAMLK